MEDLTAFQRDILYVIGGVETPYGLAIKRGLEEYYGESVNHGRLYPNLDTLVEMGLVEKSPIDRRTNRYTITDGGHATIRARREWETAQMGDAAPEPTENAPA